MTILLAGGGGYIGSQLASFLAARGHEVIVLDRFFFGKESVQAMPRVRLVQDDIRSFDPACLRGCDAVIDLAGFSNDPSCDMDPALSEDVNIRGGLTLARAAKESGVRRYFYSSSCSVYGHTNNQCADERSATNPVTLYAKMKERMERMLLALSSPLFSVTIVRTATCYGVSRRMRFDLAVNLMTLRAMRDGRITVLGQGQQWRPFIHLEDVCRAYGLFLTAELSLVCGEVFNLGFNEQNYQIVNLAAAIKQRFPGTVIDFSPDDPEKRSYRISFDKIARTLQFAPRKTIADGVEEIHGALLSSSICVDARSNTAQYYAYLIDAERTLRSISLNGALF